MKEAPASPKAAVKHCRQGMESTIIDNSLSVSNETVSEDAWRRDPKLNATAVTAESRHEVDDSSFRKKARRRARNVLRSGGRLTKCRLSIHDLEDRQRRDPPQQQKEKQQQRMSRHLLAEEQYPQRVSKRSVAVIPSLRDVLGRLSSPRSNDRKILQWTAEVETKTTT